MVPYPDEEIQGCNLVGYVRKEFFVGMMNYTLLPGFVRVGPPDSDGCIFLGLAPGNSRM